MGMLAPTLVLLLALTGEDAGYERLAGHYSGTMAYHDDTDGKDKSMPIDLMITKKDRGSVWNWTYHYAPGKMAKEVGECFSDGKTWREKNEKEDLTFELKGWSQFCSGSQKWFEIERPAKLGRIGGDSKLFRRRYTVLPDRLISEKWLKPEGKPFYVSHRMDLKRIP